MSGEVNNTETPLMASLSEYKNPVVIFCLGTLAGATFYFREIKYLFLFLLFFLVLLIISLLKKKKFLILLFSLLFGYVYCFGYFKIFIPNLDNLTKQKNIYIGEITSDPESWGFYAKYYFNVKSIVTNSKIQKINAKVQVSGSKYEKYQKGDVVQLTGTLKFPKSALLPGLFDEKKYLFTKGIKYILKAEPGSLVFLGKVPASFIYEKIAKLQEKIEAVNSEYLKPDNLALINGILLGSKASKPNQNLKEKIQNLGLSHITAASGFNVSILAAGIFYLMRMFSRRKLLPTIVSIFAVLLYSSLADFSASVNRAAIFIILVLMGNLFDKKIKILPGISLVLLLFFIFNPVNVLDVGLQLSVMAFLGILLFSEEIGTCHGKSLQKWLTQIFLQSLIAQIMVLPLIVFYFHNIQLLGLISNIVAVPLASVILILGLINVIFAFVPFLQALNVFSCILLGIFSNAFLKWINFLYKFPLKLVYIPNIDFYVLILIYIFVIFTLCALFVPQLRKSYKILAPVLILLFVSAYFFFDQSKNLRIFSIPEYNQEKVLIIFPHGTPVLITSSKSKNNIKAVSEYMRKNNLPPKLQCFNLHGNNEMIKSDFMKDNGNEILVEYKNFKYKLFKSYDKKIADDSNIVQLPRLKKSDPTLVDVFNSYPENIIINDYKKLSLKSKNDITLLKSKALMIYLLSETGTIAIVSDGEKYKIIFEGK